MTRRTSSLLLVAGFITGLLVRFGLAFDMGVGDMQEYYNWGKRVLEVGLPRGYHGIYFPLQYQLFEACAAMVSYSGLKFFAVFKLANFAFDVGSFFLLLSLLKRQQANPLYALLYWLHPWFLTVFSLGYCDFQFAFFVLLALWLLRRDTIRDYVLAGFLVGFMSPAQPGEAYIHFVGVHPKERSHGLGRRLYTTFLASSFRSLRFGLADAHGKGMALQFNYLSDKGAFVAKPDGAFAVNGARADNAGFVMDGMNNTQRRNTGAMIAPPLEGVQEFPDRLRRVASAYRWDRSPAGSNRAGRRETGARLGVPSARRGRSCRSRPCR